MKTKKLVKFELVVIMVYFGNIIAYFLSVFLVFVTKRIILEGSIYLLIAMLNGTMAMIMADLHDAVLLEITKRKAKRNSLCEKIFKEV